MDPIEDFLQVLDNAATGEHGEVEEPISWIPVYTESSNAPVCFVELGDPRG